MSTSSQSHAYMYNISHMSTCAVWLSASHMLCVWRIGKVIRPVLPLQTQEKEEKTILHETRRKCVGDCRVVNVCVCGRICVHVCHVSIVNFLTSHIFTCMPLGGRWPVSCNCLPLIAVTDLDYSYNYSQLSNTAKGLQTKLHTVILLSKVYPLISWLRIKYFTLN